MPAFRVSTGLHVEHRRPKAGDGSHEGLLKVERRGFRVLGVWGSGLWGLGFRSLGFRVQVFGVQGLLGLQVFGVQGLGL